MVGPALRPRSCRETVCDARDLIETAFGRTGPTDLRVN